MYQIHVNGKKLKSTTSWKKANEIFNKYFYDLFEHNYVEIINVDTGEIMKGGAR